MFFNVLHRSTDVISLVLGFNFPQKPFKPVNPWTLCLSSIVDILITEINVMDVEHVL